MRGAAKCISEKNKKPLIIAEIGVSHGNNAVAMLNEMNIERLYLIDPFLNYEEGPYIRNTIIQAGYYKKMFKNIEPYLSKITLVTKGSMFSSLLFEKEFFDFVYIDGAHNQPQVRKDCVAWWPLVKKGGVLGGHDIGHVCFPGVAKAVEWFSKQVLNVFKIGEGSDWWIEKD